MIVVKITGKTEAMPLATGSPARFKMSAKAITTAAASPRTTRIRGLTRRAPFGAGCGVMLAAIPSAIPVANAITPTTSDCVTLGWTSSFNCMIPAAMASHAPSASATVHSKRCERVRRPIVAGMTRQSTRYPALSRMPIGTNAMARRKPSMSSPAPQIPIAAGTMVVGMLERTPPRVPPSRSTAIVERTATSPAKAAGSASAKKVEGSPSDREISSRTADVALIEALYRTRVAFDFRAPCVDSMVCALLGDGLRAPFRRHASEQYFTVSQSRSHFFRQVNGRPHTTQSLGGGTGARTILGMRASSSDLRGRFASQHRRKRRKSLTKPPNARAQSALTNTSSKLFCEFINGHAIARRKRDHALLLRVIRKGGPHEAMHELAR